MVLVRRSDQVRRQRLSNEYDERSEAFLTGRAAPILNAFETQLARLPSVAAVYRTLQQSGFDIHETVGTFRQHWQGPRQWIELNIHLGDLPKVMRRVGLSDARITARVAALSKLRRADEAECRIVTVVVPSLRAVMGG